MPKDSSCNPSSKVLPTSWNSTTPKITSCNPSSKVHLFHEIPRCLKILHAVLQPKSCLLHEIPQCLKILHAIRREKILPTSWNSTIPKDSSCKPLSKVLPTSCSWQSLPSSLTALLPTTSNCRLFSNKRRTQQYGRSESWSNVLPFKLLGSVYTGNLQLRLFIVQFILLQVFVIPSSIVPGSAWTLLLSIGSSVIIFNK